MSKALGEAIDRIRMDTDIGKTTYFLATCLHCFWLCKVWK